MSKLIGIVESLPRIEVIRKESNYLYFTQTSLIFRFKDDVEFYFKESENKLHFRSASRVGRKDFGVNKKRIEQILNQLK